MTAASREEDARFDSASAAASVGTWRIGDRFVVLFLGVLERDPHVASVAQALVPVLLEAAPQHAAHLRRRVARESAPVRLLGDDGGERVGQRRALERSAAGQHLVEHAAERPEIGPLDRPRSPRACSGLM